MDWDGLAFTAEEKHETGVRPGRYRDGPPVPVARQNVEFLRYADVLLMLAEAEVESNGDLEKPEGW